METSVTRSGGSWKFSVTTVITKVDQIWGNFWGYLEIHNFWVKTAVGTIWATFWGEIGLVFISTFGHTEPETIISREPFFTILTIFCGWKWIKKTETSVTRLGYFWNVLTAKILQKLAQIFRDFFSSLEKGLFGKNYYGYSFCATLGKIGPLFYINIWSHWLRLRERVLERERKVSEITPTCSFSEWYGWYDETDVRTVAIFLQKLL